MNLTTKLAACAAFAFALAPAAGCAGSKPPQAPTAANATGPSAASTAPTTTAKNGDGLSNVNISDEIRKKCGISDADAYFDFDAAQVRSQDIRPLDQVAQCFISGPLAGRSLRLVGHADPRGNDEYNMLLGHKRADAVQSYLSNHGLDKSKAESTSRGAMDATGRDESGWSKDRRVDVLLAQ